MLYVGNKIPKQVTVGGGNAKAVFYGSRIVWAPDWATEKKAQGGEIKPGTYVYYSGMFWRATQFSSLSPSSTASAWERI
ncbi:hypothetical protein [Corynebacterium phage IME1320_01]|nr:hypothetical protein [Corynebacterium phage IME1320_01]